VARTSVVGVVLAASILVAACSSAGEVSPTSTEAVTTSAAVTTAAEATAAPSTTAAPTTPAASTVTATTIALSIPPSSDPALGLARAVLEPYSRWAFSGLRGPVLGDCFLGSCRFDLDAVVTPELRATLAQRATDLGVDPITCSATPSVLVPHGGTSPSLADPTVTVVWGEFAGRAAGTGASPQTVTLTVERDPLRLSGVECTPPTAAPSPVALPTRDPQLVGKLRRALNLVWRLYEPYVGSPEDQESVGGCIGRTDCTLDVGEYLTPAFEAELTARSEAVDGMVDLVACAQSSTVLTGVDDVALDGQTATFTVHDWWDRRIVVSVDLGTNRVSGITCPA
jgi:hypothetical protein